MSGPTGEGERLQKVLARVGVGSRRACEELIAAGRVAVNDEVAALGRRVDPGRDRVAIDGVAIGIRPGLVYYVLNKPAGVITHGLRPTGPTGGHRPGAGRAPRPPDRPPGRGQ